jgi:hypothetical protein
MLEPDNPTLEKHQMSDTDTQTITKAPSIRVRHNAPLKQLRTAERALVIHRKLVNMLEIATDLARDLEGILENKEK